MKLYKPTKKEKRDAVDKVLDRLVKRYGTIKRKPMTYEEFKDFLLKDLFVE
jgi:hypothetical protein